MKEIIEKSKRGRPRKEGENRVVKTITIDKEIWDYAGPALDKIHMTRSRFIELTLRTLRDGEKKTMEDTMGDLFMDMAHDAMANIEKDKIRETLSMKRKK